MLKYFVTSACPYSGQSGQRHTMIQVNIGTWQSWTEKWWSADHSFIECGLVILYYYENSSLLKSKLIL